MTVLAQELIRRTRNRERLSDDEVRELVAGITDGGLSDAQVAAWAMAAWVMGVIHRSDLSGDEP